MSHVFFHVVKLGLHFFGIIPHINQSKHRPAVDKTNQVNYL